MEIKEFIKRRFDEEEQKEAKDRNLQRSLLKLKANLEEDTEKLNILDLNI